MKIEKRFRFGGYSSRYGVTFLGSKYAVACYKTSENEEPKIVVKEKMKSKKGNKIFDKSNYLKQINNEDIFSNVIVSLFFLVLGAISLVIQRFIYNTIFFYIIFGSVQLLIAISVIKLMINLYFSGDYEVVARHHGAEHMVSNAFRKYGYVPEIDKIRKLTRFHPRCGITIPTNFLFAINISFAISIAFHKFNIPVMPLTWLGILAMDLPTFNPYSVLIQLLFSTKKPNDEDIILAQYAYFRLYQLESDVNSEVKFNEYTAIKKLEILEESFLDNEIDIETYYDCCESYQDLVLEEEIQRELFKVDLS